MNIQTNVPHIKCTILLAENTKRLNLKTESTNEFIFYCNPSKDFCVVFIVFLWHTAPQSPYILWATSISVSRFPFRMHCLRFIWRAPNNLLCRTATIDISHLSLEKRFSWWRHRFCQWFSTFCPSISINRNKRDRTMFVFNAATSIKRTSTSSFPWFCFWPLFSKRILPHSLKIL